ncbi:MAG: hypothetical protein QOD96_5157 [Pseudonocardiales bacterium]|nr:hypothetical protein [Pseudonocardiales bacterium]
MRRNTHGTKVHRHPLVGELVYSYEALPVPADPDQTLCVYSVEPGSAAEQAPRLLDC